MIHYLGAMEELIRIRKVAEQLHPLTDEAWADLSDLFTYAELKKGAFLVRGGEKTETLAFVLDGALRAYFIDKEGTEYNKTFFLENSFAASIGSILQNIPSYLNFDALLDTKILKANYHEVVGLFERHRCLESMVRKLYEYEWIIQKEQRELRLVMNSATERYVWFQKEYPGLENLIPQYHIASHLGITPVQLSRIRARRKNP